MLRSHKLDENMTKNLLRFDAARSLRFDATCSLRFDAGAVISLTPKPACSSIFERIERIQAHSSIFKRILAYLSILSVFKCIQAYSFVFLRFLAYSCVFEWIERI